jgi:hypothetical protein
MDSARLERLEPCRIPGTDLYRATLILQFVEGISAKQAGSRMATLKSKYQQALPFHKHGTTVCIAKADIENFVSKLKECQNKELVLGQRQEDETKVRTITLHAGQQEVTLEVSCDLFRSALIMLGWIIITSTLT